MGFWERHVVPRGVEVVLSGKDMADARALVCEGLTGRVLEIGFGSGMNTRYYPSEVISVGAVEPNDLGWRMSDKRRRLADVRIERVGLDGQRLGAEDGSYHCVLSTFTLCTIPDVRAALSEVRRVLLPGGSLHFLEHGLAPTPGVARWQRRLEPVQKRMAAGCHLTRDIPELVAEAGLEVVELRQEYLPRPAPTRPWTYVSIGRATA
jgi:ubiquinone/menaquinone biosynthesis C-methylase UbiE